MGIHGECGLGPPRVDVLGPLLFVVNELLNRFPAGSGKGSGQQASGPGVQCRSGLGLAFPVGRGVFSPLPLQLDHRPSLAVPIKVHVGRALGSSLVDEEGA